LKGLASVIIGGFQRFSLLDYPGKLSAIVFTQGCNFRCPYCHNPDLVDPLRYQLTIPEEEILAFLKQRKGRLGAVTITGGEPTLQKALLPFIRKVKAMDYVIKLDTNGSKPEVLSELINLGLIDGSQSTDASVSFGHSSTDRRFLDQGIDGYYQE
jgi:pyruvate formate lyase activating enzyme